MSVILFPKAPNGPRPGGAFVLNLPLISMSVEPQLYFDVDPADQKAITAEIAYLTAAFGEFERSVNRLVELVKPYRIEAAR